MGFIWKLGWLRGFSILREKGKIRFAPHRMEREPDFFLQRY